MVLCFFLVFLRVQKTVENIHDIEGYKPDLKYNQLLKKYDLLDRNHQKLSLEYQFLKHELDQLKRTVFGKKTEKFTNTDGTQLSLFNIDKVVTSEEATENITYTRKKNIKKKQKPSRTIIPAHLPRVEEIIEPNIEPGMIKIGEQISETLEYNPSRIFVRRIIRPKYAYANKEGVAIANLPSMPIPKGKAGASLLAYIMVAKFIDHLPFYRQIQIFKRFDLVLTDSTISGWFNKTTDLLEPLYECLMKQILSCDYLQADETPIGVQDSNKKGSLHNGYHWVYRSPLQKLVMFKYSVGRARKAPEEVLLNFSGALQTDGYIAYTNMKTQGDIILLACMTHARRKFDAAKDNNKKLAEEFLSLFQLLYHIERQSKDKKISYNTRYRYRQLYSKPVLLKIEKLLKHNLDKIIPQSPIGKAISYTLNLWSRLCIYINDGRFEIDNNAIENSIRPLAIGRKNYMFAGSHKAAQRAAMMYSFFATCKINNIEPHSWLVDVLNRISEHKANKLPELLPQNWKKITT